MLEISYDFRFMFGESQNIAACILGTKYEATNQPHYYLSAGVYSGLMWHLIDTKYHADLITLCRQNNEQTVSTILSIV